MHLRYTSVSNTEVQRRVSGAVRTSQLGLGEIDPAKMSFLFRLERGHGAAEKVTSPVSKFIENYAAEALRAGGKRRRRCALPAHSIRSVPKMTIVVQMPLQVEVTQW